VIYEKRKKGLFMKHRVYTVSKNISNIFDFNLKKDYQILTLFSYEYFLDNLLLNTCLLSYLTQSLFVHYLGKAEPTKYCFFPKCSTIA